MEKTTNSIKFTNGKVISLYTVLFSITMVISTLAILLSVIMSISYNVHFFSKSTIYSIITLVVSVMFLFFKK